MSEGTRPLFWDAFGYANPHAGITRFARYLQPHMHQEGWLPDVLDADHAITPKSQLAWRFKPVWIETVAERLMQKASTATPRAIFHAQSNFNLTVRHAFYRSFRTVLTVHDVIPLLEGKRWQSPLAWQMRAYLDGALARADAVHCISEWTRDCLCELYPKHHLPGKLRVIPNGMQPLQEASLRHPVADPMQLLFVSRYEDYKGFGLFLDIARRAIAAGSQAIMVTNPQGMLWVREKAEDLLATGALAVFVGLAQDDLHALLRESSVLVHPSRYEGFCLPAMEAMSHGVPVVYMRGSGIDEVVGEGVAIGMRPGDPIDAWFNAVIRAAEWRATDAYVTRLRQHLAQKMSWAAVASSLRKLYNEL